MTRCFACSTDNPAGHRYCARCGTQLVKICPKCDQQVDLSASFCGYCGVAFDVERRPAMVEQAAPSSFGGEFKQATVLFADIDGSTEMVASLDSEQAMERLRPAVQIMCDAVENVGGTVVSTLGDGIMALFGAPRAQEGHALLACEAALAMQRAFAPRAGEMTIRVALHSGEVVADAPSSDPGRERRVHGLAVHLANRLLAVTEPGGICISADCQRLVRGASETTPIGSHALRGVPGPVDVYRLVALRPALASQRFRGMALASLRGRGVEIATLQRTLVSVENGEAEVLGIAGAPGTGKSRLCYEFVEWCRSRLIPVFEGRAQPYGHATPLQPVLELLRGLFFRLSPGDDPADARRRICEHLRDVEPEFIADVPLMAEFLGVPDTAGQPLRVHPTARRERLQEIVRAMVRHNGAALSVIVIEDLHWLDEASEDFVTTIVEAVAGTRTMLVLNYRPAYAARWMRLGYFRQILLGELSQSETGGLVDELIGRHPDLRDIRRRVVERSSGNPFFTEELIRSLVESDVLRGEARNYRPGREAGEGNLPPTVQAVIGARLDRLGDAQRGLLQIVAVIGKEIPQVLLERVAEEPQARIEAGLQALCEADLLQIQPSSDGPRYAFRHPLIQEVAYRTQLKARRARVHAAVAEAMQSYYEDRIDEYAGLLSHHHEAAGQFLAAATYAARAAMWVGSTNSSQAINHWHKVRVLLRHQPRDQPTDALRIMSSGQIAWLGWREGLTAKEAKPFLQEALTWAREIDDSMVSLLLFVEGRITWASGGAAAVYIDRVNEALSLLKPDADPGRAATLYAGLTQIYGWSGLLKQARAANDMALRSVADGDAFDDQFLGYSVEHWAMSLRGRILLRLGQVAEAERSCEAMLEIAQSLLDPTVQIIAHVCYVDIAWCRGDARLAEIHAGSLTEIADRYGSPYLRVFALACRGIAHSVAGRLGAAIEDLTASLNFIRQSKAAMEWEAEILASLADCHLQAADYESAMTTAIEAIATARQGGTRLPECRASIAYGGALIATYGTARRDDAVALLDRAEALIDETGARIYEKLLLRERLRLLTLVA